MKINTGGKRLFEKDIGTDAALAAGFSGIDCQPVVQLFERCHRDDVLMTITLTPEESLRLVRQVLTAGGAMAALRKLASVEA